MSINEIESGSVSAFLYFVEQKSLDDEASINYVIEFFYLLNSCFCDYIWNNDCIRIQICQAVLTSSLAHWHVRFDLHFDDNYEDEWLFVSLLFEVSRRFNDVIIRFEDSDGEFLLIEAAHALPDWIASSSTASIPANRLWLHNGTLFFIQSERTKALPLDRCLEIVRHAIITQQDLKTATNQSREEHDQSQTLHSLTVSAAAIQRAIEARIPAASITRDSPQLRHRTTVFLPASLVRLLHINSPLLLTQCLAAFFAHQIDGADGEKEEVRMRRFPAREMLSIRLDFSRFQFAKLHFAVQKYCQRNSVAQHRRAPSPSSLKGEDKKDDTQSWTNLILQENSLHSSRSSATLIGYFISLGAELLLRHQTHNDQRLSHHQNLILSRLNEQHSNPPRNHNDHSSISVFSTSSGSFNPPIISSESESRRFLSSMMQSLCRPHHSHTNTNAQQPSPPHFNWEVNQSEMEALSYERLRNLEWVGEESDAEPDWLSIEPGELDAAMASMTQQPEECDERETLKNKSMTQHLEQFLEEKSDIQGVSNSKENREEKKKDNHKGKKKEKEKNFEKSAPDFSLQGLIDSLEQFHEEQHDVEDEEDTETESDESASGEEDAQMMQYLRKMDNELKNSKARETLVDNWMMKKEEQQGGIDFSANLRNLRRDQKRSAADSDDDVEDNDGDDVISGNQKLMNCLLPGGASRNNEIAPEIPSAAGFALGPGQSILRNLRLPVSQMQSLTNKKIQF